VHQYRLDGGVDVLGGERVILLDHLGREVVYPVVGGSGWPPLYEVRCDECEATVTVCPIPADSAEVIVRRHEHVHFLLLEMAGFDAR
jgi:hypothetical protein